jgi:hypothetical protein
MACRSVPMDRFDPGILLRGTKSNKQPRKCRFRRQRRSLLSSCRTRGSVDFPQKARLSHRGEACANPFPLLFSGSRNKALQRTTAAGCKREMAVLLSRSCKKAVGLPTASVPSQERSEPSRFDQVGKPVRRISSGNAPDPCWETSENNPPQDPGDLLSCASVARANCRSMIDILRSAKLTTSNFDLVTRTLSQMRGTPASNESERPQIERRKVDTRLKVR